MGKIELQKKTKAQNATVEAYWFENESIGLNKTLFYRITIPLEPFDSGLEYEEQPLSTEIVLDWYELKLENPDELNWLICPMNHTQKPKVRFMSGLRITGVTLRN